MLSESACNLIDCKNETTTKDLFVNKKLLQNIELEKKHDLNNNIDCATKEFNNENYKNSNICLIKINFS